MDAGAVADTAVTPRAGGLTRALWLASALFIVYGTTLPFKVDTYSPHLAGRLRRLAVSTPWALQAADHLSIPDVVQNILLFVPFGALGLLACRRGSLLARVLLITAAAALLSGCVEILQLFTADRVSSVTDLLTNTVGAAAGACAAVIGGGICRRARDRALAAGLIDRATFYPLLIMLGVLVLSALQPFDVTLDVGTVGHKIRLLLQDPWQFTGVDDEGIAAMQAALLAVAACRWLSVRSVASPAVAGGMAVALLAVGLEGSQALIQSRQPGLADALVGVAGAAAGAALWAARRGRASRPLAVAGVGVATAVGATLQMLSPFTLASHYQPVEWVPFLNYYAYTSFNTVSHTIELVLLYLPLGFVFASGAPRTGRALATAAFVGACLAIPLEYLQGWVSGRYPDVTDVVVSVAGCAAGAWLATDGAARFAALTGDAGD